MVRARGRTRRGPVVNHRAPFLPLASLRDEVD